MLARRPDEPRAARPEGHGSRQGDGNRHQQDPEARHGRTIISTARYEKTMTTNSEVPRTGGKPNAVHPSFLTIRRARARRGCEARYLGFPWAWLAAVPVMSPSQRAMASDREPAPSLP